MAYAIENARLYERTRRSLRELEQLSRLGAHIARAESVDDLLSVTVERAIGLLGAESLRVYLLEPSGDRLRMRAASPGAPDGPDIVSLPELSGELQRTRPAAARSPRCSRARSGARPRCAPRSSRRSSPATR